MADDRNDPTGFETDIKALVPRNRPPIDAEALRPLWSYDDVSRHAEAILARLREGTMPCDGSWPQAQIGLFQRWTENGKPQ